MKAEPPTALCLAWRADSLLTKNRIFPFSFAWCRQWSAVWSRWQWFACLALSRLRRRFHKSVVGARRAAHLRLAEQLQIFVRCRRCLLALLLLALQRQLCILWLVVELPRRYILPHLIVRRIGRVVCRRCQVHLLFLIASEFRHISTPFPSNIRLCSVSFRPSQPNSDPWSALQPRRLFLMAIASCRYNRRRLNRCCCCRTDAGFLVCAARVLLCDRA